MGLRIHNDAKELNENTYLRLRLRKEKAFIKQEKELYDFDPRALLADDKTVFVRADKFISGELIQEEDTFIYEMTQEEKEHVHQLIKAFDKRPPFDVQKCKEDFEQRQLMIQIENKARIPEDIFAKIADPRVFALGYSTKEIIQQLKQIGQENERIIQHTLDDFAKVQQAQEVSEHIKENFGFHDCKVLNVKKHKDITIEFDSSYGFNNNNRIVFHDAFIVKEDRAINGTWWIYEEIYKKSDGYEVHMLFADDHDSKIELTIESKDITIDYFES
jgi:hypothetical protein